MVPLVVHCWLTLGSLGARATNGADASIMWFVGSLESGFPYGICDIHGCSNARTKSMATSMLSTHARASLRSGGAWVAEIFMDWKEKS